MLTRKETKYVVIASLAVLLFYLLVSFVELSSSPYDWGKGARFLFAMLSGAAIVLTFLIHTTESNE